MEIDDLLWHARSRHLTHTQVPPAPRAGVVVVTCMDTRIDPLGLLGAQVGDLHVIRNAGGIVTEDVLRSLAVSTLTLGTHSVLLISHTDCAVNNRTEAELTGLAGGQAPASGWRAFTDVDASLRNSARMILDCTYVRGPLAVHGFVFDVATGALREVDLSPPDDAQAEAPQADSRTAAENYRDF